MSHDQKSTYASGGELSDQQLDAVAGGGGSEIAAGAGGSTSNLGTLTLGDGGSSDPFGASDPLALDGLGLLQGNASGEGGNLQAG